MARRKKAVKYASNWLNASIVGIQFPVAMAIGYFWGKWMDGWESRRKRGPGHDYAVVALAAPTVIRGLDVDTSHFTGNYPPAFSIDACRLSAGETPGEATEWRQIVAITPLGPSSRPTPDPPSANTGRPSAPASR